ncbi:MAG TPA: PIN domain-containing protein [Polyangia bacterium]|jgi:predicted nucleic acid-binding protein
MAKKSVEPALTDTNVLVDATDVKRPRHQAALALLEQRPGLVLSAQVAREYLAVATRPAAVNGLGLPLRAALENLAELRRVLRLLPEEKPLLPTLLALLREVPCEGKAIHDALLVATMRVHRVKVLVTSNPHHFDRFRSLVDLVEPTGGG